MMLRLAFLLITMFTILAGAEEVAVRKTDCGFVTIKCVCGIGRSRRILSLELKVYSIPDSVREEVKCSGLPDPYRACSNHSCILLPRKTRDLSLQSFYPEEFTIPAGGSERFTRQSDPCKPKPLKNAFIKCWKWPNWINCDITCIYGYALLTSEVSEVTNVNCRMSENRWKPHGFIDCKPYVNCRARLVMPGKLRCHQPIDGPAYCDISCLDYDQYEATNKRRYDCLDQTFARTLPHCAVLQDNVALIPKPNSKETYGHKSGNQDWKIR